MFTAMPPDLQSTDNSESQQIHGTAIVLDGYGILFCGLSGAGKPDLALRLLDRGARMIADDRCDLRCWAGRLFVSAPATIAGRLEVRGLGIVEVSAVEVAALDLVVDLIPRADVPRLPEPVVRTYLGISLPLLRLAPFDASAPAKLALAAARVAHLVNGS
jgi:HPr kinase/phosphorylase